MTAFFKKYSIIRSISTDPPAFRKKFDEKKGLIES